MPVSNFLTDHQDMPYATIFSEIYEEKKYCMMIVFLEINVKWNKVYTLIPEKLKLHLFYVVNRLKLCNNCKVVSSELSIYRRFSLK